MKRFAVLALLALFVAGSASAAPSAKPKWVRVVRHHGDATALLTYKDWSRVPLRDRPRATTYSAVTLSLRERGRLVVRHRICPLVLGAGCAWVAGVHPLEFSPVAGSQTPAAVVVGDTGGASCCENMFMAVGGTHPGWIAHDWGTAGYLLKRIAGRYRLISRDNRFWFSLGACGACSYLPVQVWAVKEGELVDVTRDVPRLVRRDARLAWHEYALSRNDTQYRGLNALAGWCADEFLIRRGSNCEHELRHLRARGLLDRLQKPSGPAFIAALNRYLMQLGYKRR